MSLDEGEVAKMWEGLNHKGNVFRKLLHKAKIRKRSNGGGEESSPLPLLINVCSTKGSKCPGDLPKVSPSPKPHMRKLMQHLTVKAPRQ